MKHFLRITMMCMGVGAGWAALQASEILEEQNFRPRVEKSGLGRDLARTKYANCSFLEDSNDLIFPMEGVNSPPRDGRRAYSASEVPLTDKERLEKSAIKKEEDERIDFFPVLGSSPEKNRPLIKERSQSEYNYIPMNTIGRSSSDRVISIGLTKPAKIGFEPMNP